MTPAQRLLQAAERCDIDDLGHLATACGIVGDISRFIHVLQKERGASNVFLASGGQRFVERRRERIEECHATEAAMRQRLGSLDGLTNPSRRPATSARLLRRIAQVWHSLDALGELREAISAQRVSPDEATLTYNRLISGLLSVVFEAADTASDTEITLALVAVFHFMQGKELAGQERACGAFGFTTRQFDSVHRQLLSHLVEAQNRCFETFREFATREAQQAWEAAISSRTQASIQQLRDLAYRPEPLADGEVALGENWYDLTTCRIDAMQQVEAYLTHELSALCRQRIDGCQARLHDQQALTWQLEQTAQEGISCQLLVEAFETSPGQQLGEMTAQVVDFSLNRSLIDLVRAQANRLQSLSDELDNTRKALRERKLIERAKGLVMANQQMTEEQAYRFMRKTAMDQSRSMAEVARSIFDLADLLKPPGDPRD